MSGTFVGLLKKEIAHLAHKGYNGVSDSTIVPFKARQELSVYTLSYIPRAGVCMRMVVSHSR